MKRDVAKNETIMYEIYKGEPGGDITVSLVIKRDMVLKIAEVMDRYGFTKSAAIRFLVSEGYDALSETGRL